jgi:hypothetical protein
MRNGGDERKGGRSKEMSDIEDRRGKKYVRNRSMSGIQVPIGALHGDSTRCAISFKKRLHYMHVRQ